MSASSSNGEAPTEPARARPELAGTPAPELDRGAIVGDYVVEARRGSGGFATVYRARDRRDGAAVALKVLHPYLSDTPSILRRFQREADTIARLDHPSIVRLLGFGDHGGVPFLAMEWVDGVTLAELLRDRGPLAFDEALPILEALAAAIAVAHGAGIVHRDLKAANVALADRDVKLLDFGIAKLLDAGDGSGLTTAGTKLGTPHYMAPEQVLGKPVDHRADIYAFGILVFEMLTGRRPFDGGNLAEIEERQLVEPPPAASRLAGVPATIDAVISRAMAKDPARRHGSIVELIADVRAGRDAGRTERRRAVALYVHAAARGDDPSDDALDRIDRVLADARTGAAAAGLAVVVETASSLLLVAAAGAAVERVEAFARELARGAAHPELVVALTVHAGEVELADGDRHVGGALLDVASWVRTGATGVVVTPAARS